MIIIYLYIYLEPNVTQLTSIFEGQPSKTRPCSIKTRVIWVLAKYEYIYIYIYMYSSIYLGSTPHPGRIQSKGL